MDKSKNGTNFYKAVCAVAFILFSLVYLYYYQTDILAAAQHIASGGRTHYEPVLGTVLIILVLKLLQNGIQAIVRLRRIFFALTYFPSFLILTLITDIPSGSVQEIDFGAWKVVLPLALIVWGILVYFARQYQTVEFGARGGGLLSQVLGINVTLFLAMMLMTCLIGNHNRLFHQRLHVENLISRHEYRDAQVAAENYNSKDETILMLRACALAQQRLIGDELFKTPMNGVKSVIPSSNGTYTVILPSDKLLNSYKRNADWQLCEMLVRKDLKGFFDNLVFFYNLGDPVAQTDSVGKVASVSKNVKKQNAYKDSLLSIRFQKLPTHYQEAIVLYNYLYPRSPFIKPSYINKNIQQEFNKFQETTPEDRRKHFRGTYWMFYAN